MQHIRRGEASAARHVARRRPYAQCYGYGADMMCAARRKFRHEGLLARRLPISRRLILPSICRLAFLAI